MTLDWLETTPGDAPLILSLPHAGTEVPAELEGRFFSPWLARKDTDWHVDKLYGFAADLDVTVLRTRLSRSVIDVNRDPSGASLYPGRTTTGLCPVETFDGEPLYPQGGEPDAAEIADRRARFFDPYHQALAGEIARLRASCPAVLIYEAHSIRSRVPRLFSGELPVFNIGTNGGRSCAPALARAVESVCDASGCSRITDGRFKGGWTTRHYGRPDAGVHALQMELACRGYLHEPLGAVTAETWPAAYDAAFAAPLRDVLERVLRACLLAVAALPRR